jgi:hypothetical protein
VCSVGLIAELVTPEISSAPVEGSAVDFGSWSSDKGGIGSGIGFVVGTSPERKNSKTSS